jgi:hypothetical protein
LWSVVISSWVLTAYEPRPRTFVVPRPPTAAATAVAYEIDAGRGACRITRAQAWCVSPQILNSLSPRQPTSFDFPGLRVGHTTDETRVLTNPGSVHPSRNVRSRDEWYVESALWYPAALLAILPITWLIRARPPRRAAVDTCPFCGYDLRATPQRCPECGREIVAAIVIPVRQQLPPASPAPLSKTRRTLLIRRIAGRSPSPTRR